MKSERIPAIFAVVGDYRKDISFVTSIILQQESKVIIFLHYI